MHLYPAVKNLLFLHLFIYLFQILSEFAGTDERLTQYFALNYIEITQNFKIWTIFTYMFVHGGFLHLLFNMLIFFFCANEVERAWGSRKFLQFYLLSGMGAGLFIFAATAVRIHFFGSAIADLEYTVGASGAIFALLLAYSFLFVEKEITLLIFFILPITIKGKYLVWLCLALTIIMSPMANTSISHAGHIGGILSGLLFFLVFGRKQPYYYAYNQMILFFREIFSLARGIKIKTINHKNLFNIKSNFNKNFNEDNMSDLEIEEEIDYLLDKISDKGIRSLSTEEKNFLNRISIRYQHKFPQ